MKVAIQLENRLPDPYRAKVIMNNEEVKEAMLPWREHFIPFVKSLIVDAAKEPLDVWARFEGYSTDKETTDDVAVVGALYYQGLFHLRAIVLDDVDKQDRKEVESGLMLMITDYITQLKDGQIYGSN